MPLPDYLAEQDTPQEPTGGSTPSPQAHTLGAVPGLYNLLRQHSEQPDMGVSLDEMNAGDFGLGSDPAFAVADNAMLATPTFDEASSMSFAPEQDNSQNLMGDLLMKTPNAHLGTGRAAVVAFARKMLGTPYVWGGTSMTGVDCSGLVQLALKQAGVNAPRISADQARMGRRVALDQLKPGDLVAMDNSSRNHGADHIAIYIGGGMVIEAPRPGGVVQVASVNEFKGGWGVSLGY